MGEGLGQPSQEQRLVEPALGHERLAARLQALGNLPFLSSLRASFNSGAIKKQNGNASYWWLRSAYSLGTGTFRYLNKDGYLDCYYAKTDYGVAVAFRIG